MAYLPDSASYGSAAYQLTSSVVFECWQAKTMPVWISSQMRRKSNPSASSRNRGRYPSGGMLFASVVLHRSWNQNDQNRRLPAFQEIYEQRSTATYGTFRTCPLARSAA